MFMTLAFCFSDSFLVELTLVGTPRQCEDSRVDTDYSS